MSNDFIDRSVSLHCDRIWQQQADFKENQIYRDLRERYPDYHVKLIDCVMLEDLPELQAIPRIISDTWLMDPNSHSNYHCLAPEIWHIILCDKIKYDLQPTHDFSCVINRVSGERLLLFYKMVRLDMLGRTQLNFNCGPQKDTPTVTRAQRLENFDYWHRHLDRPEFNDLYELWRPRMPILLDDDDPETGGPDLAAMRGRVSIIMETYHNRYSVVFSEKIFRALQTPRPWVMLCSQGAVKLLRDHGFDVLDDLVNHDSYDNEYYSEDRMDAMLAELPRVKFDPDRCLAAVDHNQDILRRLALAWSDRLAKLDQSISSRHQSRVN